MCVKPNFNTLRFISRHKNLPDVRLSPNIDSKGNYIESNISKYEYTEYRVRGGKIRFIHITHPKM